MNPPAGSAAGSPPAVEAAGLAKRFGVVTALHPLDLAVAPGRVLAVLGPNGAGKTTLLRLLAGLARPSAGHVRVGPAGADRRAARGLVGYIGHATLVYPALTARENLAFAARLQGVREAGPRIERLLAELDLAHVADRRAGTFSQGLARRLGIARGLVHDPPVVLLDEPFAGLDRAAAGRLAARLAGVKGRGRTAVLVTHDLARAAQLADEAVVLVRGRAALRVDGAGLAPDALERAYLDTLEAADAA